MAENYKIAEKIKSLRLRNNLTQTELAKKIYVSCQAVSKWERGIAMPELDKACLLAEVFNLSLDELVSFENKSKSFMLGVDGGGSKTDFLLFDCEGKIFDRFSLSGCNPNAVGINGAVSVISEGINKIISHNYKLKAVYIGASGFKTGGNGEMVKSLLSKVFPSIKFNCGTDIMNVIYASNIKENCIPAICGTGTVVYSYINGVLESYTGWGYLLDKGGSGFHIGRDGITAALEENDGLGSKTLITKLIEKKLNSKVNGHIKEFYEKGQEYIASFASCVFEAYKMGDITAAEILENNAQRTAFVINKVREKTNGINKVLISGSIFINDDYYLDLVNKYLHKDIIPVRIKLPQVFGAALLCAEFCGCDIEKIYNAFISWENLNA